MPEPQAMKTPTLRDAGVAAAAMGSMYVLLPVSYTHLTLPTKRIV